MRLMSFEILHRSTFAVLYKLKDCSDLRSAMIAAVAADANLSDADLRSADLRGANLRGANLPGANLSDADLCGADLSDADLCGADLSDADLCGADLCGADLCGADLPVANLAGACLFRAKLRGARLLRANLRGADLRGADLGCANLGGVDLGGVDLRGADLGCADLGGANLLGADLHGVKGLLPTGIIPLQIGGSQHWIVVLEVGNITIGCEHHPIEWWEEHHAAVGRRAGYSDAQVKEYRTHIQYCREWMEAKGVLTAAANATGEVIPSTTAAPIRIQFPKPESK